MKKLIILVFLAALAWNLYATQARHGAPASLAEPVEAQAVPERKAGPAPDPTPAPAPDPTPEPVLTALPSAYRSTAASAPAQRFSCDGRTMCSQMHSCEEARYFLKQCPGTNMDGDHDGVPCERQWC